MKPIKGRVSRCSAHVAGFACNVEADDPCVLSVSPDSGHLVHWQHHVRLIGSISLQHGLDPFVSLVRSSGPMIGGNLSNPMKKWPEVFRDYPLFQAYVCRTQLFPFCRLILSPMIALFTSLRGIIIVIRFCNRHVRFLCPRGW